MTYVKEMSLTLSIWSSQRNKNSPSFSTCILHIDRKRILIVSVLLKIPKEGRFLVAKQRLI